MSGRPLLGYISSTRLVDVTLRNARFHIPIGRAAGPQSPHGQFTRTDYFASEDAKVSVKAYQCNENQ